MIKVSALYPCIAGTRFDLEYYCQQHMPMVRELLGDACKGLQIEAGLPTAPGIPSPYIAAGHLYFDSLADFQQAFALHGAAIRADVPNYTDIQYVVQISEIKL